jgi:lantibiotic modifying enzyme
VSIEDFSLFLMERKSLGNQWGLRRKSTKTDQNRPPLGLLFPATASTPVGLHERMKMTVSLAWFPTHVCHSERDQIQNCIREVAHRLRDPERVLEMDRIAKEQSKYRAWIPDRLQSLAEGPAGLALLYGELHHIWPDEGWDRTAREYFDLIPQEHVYEGRYRFGLFFGVFGRFYVAQQLSSVIPEEDLYRQVRQTALERILRDLAKSRTMLVDGHPHPGHYDLFTGALGIGASLLTQAQGARPPLALLKLLFHLCWLGQRDIEGERERYVHWYRHPGLRQRQESWHALNSAYTGYGMRHGIAGLIAFFCLVLKNTPDAEPVDILEILPHLAHHLQEGLHHEAEHSSWLRKEESDDYHPQKEYSSLSWCSGLSGSAYALWLAGHALQNTTLQDQALSHLHTIGERFRQQRQLAGPGLCHGIGGLLQICARVANETRDPTLIENVHDMMETLLEQFEQDRPFGYRAFEPEFIRVDTPWLLEGAAGVALALLTVIRPDAPSWDRLLLLS